MSVPSLQLGVPVNKLLSSGGGIAEAAGCGFPDSFGDHLVVTHGHQEEEFGYNEVSLCKVNRACTLSILSSMLFPMEK